MTAAVVLVKMKKMIKMNRGYREDTLLLSEMFYDTTE